MKQMILVTGPVKTRSGYGNHARDICRALIELDKYDVVINSVRWGTTPMNALEDGNPHHELIKSKLLTSPQLPKQPDLHLHIVVPNEFTPVAKKNIGVTAGIETTVPVPQWIDGMNRMDLNIVTSEFTKSTFENARFEFKDEKTGQQGEVKTVKPMEVLFEGVDTDEYFETTKMDTEITEVFSKIDTDWNFLFTGHWLQGGVGEDRKDLGMLIKVFCEIFKDQKNQPGLILKTSSASFSVIDREDMLNRINNIKKSIKGIGDAMGDVVVKGIKGMEDALVNFVMTGTLNFRNLANSIISDMVRIAIQQTITAPFTGFISSLFKNADGNAFMNGKVQKYAYGGVVTKPTIFPMANGIGLMGEAGAEAILPLRRGSNGKLGVQSTGSGIGNIVVNVDASGSSVEGNEQGGREFGRAIAAAIQSELIKQKRPGGLLA